MRRAATLVCAVLATLPAAAAHAALLHPGGRTSGVVDRVAVAAGYLVIVGLLGLLPALLFDPRRAGCFACPDNLLLVHADPAAADWLGRWAPRAAAATEAVLAAVVVARLLRRPAAARVLAAPVSSAAVVVLGLATVENVRAAGEVADTGTDRLLWLATSGALGLLAAGIAWRPLRAARMRAALGADGDADVAAAPEVLLAAASRIVAAILRGAAYARESATDLLAADALVTFAFEAAAAEPARLGERARRAMAELSRLAAVTS
jgi:hypothetical protein